MGKANKPKRNKNRGRKAADALIRKNGTTSGTEEDIEAGQKTILPLLEKLQTADADNRSVAIRAITVMIEDSTLRKLLLKEKIVQTVMQQLITDSNEEVVAEAYGLLRNLVVEEGYDVAMFLYRQDILTPIESALSQKKPAIASDSKGQPRVLLFSFLENIFGLLTSLAQVDEEIFNSIVNIRINDLAIYLIRSLDLSKNHAGGKSLFCTTMEALYIFSEDNGPFIDQISAYPFDQILEDTACPAAAAVFVNGLKYNAYMEQIVRKNDDNTDIPLHVLQSLVPIVKTIDIESTKGSLNADIKNDDPANTHNLETARIEARSSVNVIQTSLELITAIAETISVAPTTIYRHLEKKSEAKQRQEEDDDQGMDDNDVDNEEEFIHSLEADDDSMQIEEQEQDITIDNEDVDSPILSNLQMEVLSLLTSLLPESLFQLRSMIALNNTCWTLSLQLTDKSETWNSNAFRIWTMLIPYVSNNEVTDLEVVSGAMGCLWAITKSLKPEQETLDEDLVHAIMQKSIQLVKDSDEGEEKSEFVTRSIGFLGTISMIPGQTIAVTKLVSDYLFSFITNALETPIVALVEALNMVFDIYADKAYVYDDQLFVQGGLLERLIQSLPKVRQAIKKINKKTEPVLRQAADEAGINLARFIDYKLKEQ